MHNVFTPVIGGAFLLAAAASWGAQNGDASLQRGKVLMEGIVACGNCHMARGPQGQPIPEKGLSGGMKFDDGPFVAFASNITPDRETGIGSWSDAQLARAIREGIRPDGSVIGPPMPIEWYRGIADDDLKAIIAYLRAQPAVANKVPKSEYKIPLPKSYGPPVKSVKAPPKKDLVKYGAYLAGPLGHCLECHTPMEKNGHHDYKNKAGAGGFPFNGPWGTSVARNLTPHESGLKSWNDAEIERAIREGVSRGGGQLKPPMAFPFYKTIPADDMKALIAYLRSMKPVPFGGK